MSRKIIDDGQRMRLILDDEVMVEAFGEIERQAISDWKRGVTVEAREAAWAIVRAVDAIKKQMQIVVDRGTQAETILQREQSRQK